MARQRDYKAEYQRRIANATERGFSKSQARGHARVGEASIRPMQIEGDDALELGLRLLRIEGSLKRAAKQAGVSVERLSRYVREHELAEWQGRAWKITDRRHRVMPVISRGEVLRLVLAGFEQASLNGEYLNAFKAFIHTNDRSLLAPFEGRSVIDAKNKAHVLETDPNVLYRIAASDDEVFEDVYLLILS